MGQSRQSSHHSPGCTSPPRSPSGSTHTNLHGEQQRHQSRQQQGHWKPLGTQLRSHLLQEDRGIKCPSPVLTQLEGMSSLGNCKVLSLSTVPSSQNLWEGQEFVSSLGFHKMIRCLQSDKGKLHFFSLGQWFLDILYRQKPPRKFLTGKCWAPFNPVHQVSSPVCITGAQMGEPGREGGRE